MKKYGGFVRALGNASMLGMAYVVLCMMATTASADWLLKEGDLFEFHGPNPPYSPESFQLEVTYGYGLPENTIGKGAWIQQAGRIDLSSDPGLPGFLQLATNGLFDLLTITVSDPTGGSYHVELTERGLFFNPYSFGSDLAGFTITRVEMNVWGVFPAGTIGPLDVVDVGLNFWGVPDASAGLLMLLMSALVITRRKLGY
jgi:hypothetical protein